MARIDFTFPTKHCCANGVGDSPTKGILFGERSLAASLVKTLGVGVLAISVVVLGWVCGRKSEKNGHNLSKIPLFPLAMGVGSAFGRIVWCGEEALSLAFPNLFRLITQKMLGQWICGTVTVGMGVGILSFFDLLMIGKWRRWIGFYKSFIENKSDT